MTLRRHPAHRLAAYHDGELSGPESQAVGAHVAGCDRCHAELDQIVTNAAVLSRLAVVAAPDSLWESIERAADRGGAVYVSPERVSARWIWRAAFASSVVIAAGLAYWFATRPAGAAWEVERLAGQPTAGSRRIDKTARVTAGDFLETDGASRARIRVGAIGEVEVSPGSRVRLTLARPTEYRLLLARGEIRAIVLRRYAFGHCCRSRLRLYHAD